LLNDVSNYTWTITPSTITLLSPDGGEEFFNGTMRPIRWSSQSVQNVNIEYSTNNGSNWQNIQQPVSANRTFWGWVVPAGIQSDSVKVRVRDSNDANVFGAGVMDILDFSSSSKNTVQNSRSKQGVSKTPSRPSRGGQQQRATDTMSAAGEMTGDETMSNEERRSKAKATVEKARSKVENTKNTRNSK